MDVNVEVAERPTGTFQIGAGFSSVENFIAQAQISQNNLFGRGQLLTLQAQLSSLRQLFLLQFQDLYFLDTNWTFGFNLFKQDQFLFSFVRSSKGGSLTWGYLLAEDLRLLLTYKLEDVSISTGRLRAACSRARPSQPIADRLDRQPVPLGDHVVGARARCRTTRATTACSRRRGWYNTISGEIADHVPALARTSSPATRAWRATSIRSGGRSCCALKAKAGLIASRDPRGVPIFERYFVGGIYNIRGFAPRSLGPVIRVAHRRRRQDSLAAAASWSAATCRSS